MLSLSDSAAARLEGVMVTLHGRNLFRIYSNLGNFTPAQRAERIIKAAEELILSNDPLDSITVSNGTNVTVILLGNRVLASVTSEDADLQNISRQQLAQENALKLKEAIYEFREESSLKQVLINIGISVLLTLVVFALLKGLTYLFRKLIGKITLEHGHRLPPLTFKNIEILSQERVVNLLLLLSQGVSILLKLIIVYGYLTIVFGLFVWTKTWATTLLSLVLDPTVAILSSFIAYIPNLITIVVIIFIFRLFIKLSNTFFDNIADEKLTIEGFFKEWAAPTKKIVSFLLIVFALIVIYPYSPIANSAAAQGVSLFLGIVFSLGSSTAISNMVASILLTYTRAFQLGDRIKIGEVTGDIIEKTSFVTRIRTTKNEEISVPNSTMLNSNITNYTEAVRRGEGIILHTTVTIGYDVPWRQVHQLLTDAALATEGIMDQPIPFVLQKSLDDYYPSYELNAYTRFPNKLAGIYSSLHAQIQDKFNEAGVEIMSPHYNAIRDGNTSTIPAAYLTREPAKNSL